MSYNPPIKPYIHQQEALNRSLHRENYALFMEMGTGKTKVLLDTFGHRLAAGDLDGLLVIARAGVYRNWEGEITKHLDPALLEDMHIGVWKGSARKRKEMVQTLMKNRSRGRPCALLMNVEAFSSVKDAETVAEGFMRATRTLVAIDESTSIKGHKSERTKTINRLSQFPTMRRIATGTPNPNSPLDIYSQFEFLDPRILGFSSYYGFRSRYAITKTLDTGRGKPTQIVVGYRNEAELAAKIENHRFRVLKDDCLDLPSKIYETRDVPVTGEQQKIYDEIKRYATTELEDGSHVTATSIIVRLLRLHQVLCGHVKDENNQLREIPSKRLDILIDTMEEANWDKIIVWSPFIYSIEEIVARLTKMHGPQSVVSYYGGTSSDDRVTAVRRFQEDPECKVFVGNAQTAGYGITLTAAKTIIFYSNNYDLEQRLQAEDRAHRIGLEHPVTIIDLWAQNTVDTKIIQALRKKLDLVSAINQDGYRSWLI